MGSHETICRLGTSTSMVVICVVLSALIFCSQILRTYSLLTGRMGIDIPCIIISRGLVVSGSNYRHF